LLFDDGEKLKVEIIKNLGKLKYEWVN
jgi:hypothetical protein